MVLNLKTAFSQAQAQEILDNGFQTSDMTSDIFGISEYDAKDVLGNSYAEILLGASSHFEYDEGSGNFIIDIASIKKIAEAKPVSTQHSNVRPPNFG